jgi:hypothetical protein
MYKSLFLPVPDPLFAAHPSLSCLPHPFDIKRCDEEGDSDLIAKNSTWKIQKPI